MRTLAVHATCDPCGIQRTMVVDEDSFYVTMCGCGNVMRVTKVTRAEVRRNDSGVDIDLSTVAETLGWLSGLQVEQNLDHHGDHDVDPAGAEERDGAVEIEEDDAGAGGAGAGAEIFKRGHDPGWSLPGKS